MNRTEFIKEVVENTVENKYTQKEIGEVLDAAHKVLTNALVNGDKVSFVGFGAFEVSERPAREGRNPATGEPMHIKAAKVPKFKAVKAFKESIKNS